MYALRERERERNICDEMGQVKLFHAAMMFLNFYVSALVLFVVVFFFRFLFCFVLGVGWRVCESGFCYFHMYSFPGEGEGGGGVSDCMFTKVGLLGFNTL